MKFIILFCLLTFMPLTSWSADDVESLYDKFEEKQIQKIETNLSKKRKSKKVRRGKKDNISKLDLIYDLAPLSDIAVIQRKFLPRTGRFETSLSLVGSLNNAFFTTLGGTAQIGYFFNENYGVELQYYSLTADAKAVTKSLREKNIAPSSLVSAESYIGASFVWNPVYGKMGFMNTKIVPFDIYLSAGAGTTATSLGTQAPTVHFGAGQVFAINKNWAYRWDFALNVYSFDNPDGVSAVQNDLFISLGMSYYFPDVNYR